MNCRDTEPLLLAENDGVLTNEQHAALGQHVAACPACQQLRARLAEATDAFRTSAATVPVPDVDAEWRTLQAQLATTKNRPEKKRPLAPVIWFGTPLLAAAAAIAFAFLGGQPEPVKITAPVVAEAAQADFVEAGSADASTMVYVDKESGWLVVWAADSETKTSG